MLQQQKNTGFKLRKSAVVFPLFISAILFDVSYIHLIRLANDTSSRHDRSLSWWSFSKQHHHQHHQHNHRRHHHQQWQKYHHPSWFHSASFSVFIDSPSLNILYTFDRSGPLCPSTMDIYEMIYNIIIKEVPKNETDVLSILEIDNWCFKNEQLKV